MHRRRARLAAAVVALATSAGTARAGNWPQPAMGPSRSGDPELILTFDDGPHPLHTERILDMLAAHDLHAVFFLVGWHLGRTPDAARALIEREVREGHVVANHTINHAKLCEIPEELGAIEIDGARAAIENMAHMPVIWFRTPYGARCQRVEKELADRGLHHFHWDLDPQEWRGDSSFQRAVAYITHNLALLGDGQRAVLLLHDTKASTIHVLPKVLDWIVVENRKREASGRRQIRLVPGYQLAAEQLDPELAEWTMATLRRGADDLARDLAAALP